MSTDTTNPAAVAAHKTFLGKIIATIAHLPAEIVTDIESVFNASEAAWKKLSPTVQADLEQGSSILAIINKNVSALPAVVISDIQALIPGVDLTKVQSGLTTVAVNLKAITDATASTDLPTVIAALQTYFSKFEGSTLGAITKVGASILGEAFTLLSGGSAPALQVIEELIQYIYEAVVKPKVTA